MNQKGIQNRATMQRIRGKKQRRHIELWTTSKRISKPSNECKSTVLIQVAAQPDNHPFNPLSQWPVKTLFPRQRPAMLGVTLSRHFSALSKGTENQWWTRTRAMTSQVLKSSSKPLVRLFWNDVNLRSQMTQSKPSVDSFYSTSVGIAKVKIRCQCMPFFPIFWANKSKVTYFRKTASSSKCFRIKRGISSRFKWGGPRWSDGR